MKRTPLGLELERLAAAFVADLEKILQAERVRVLRAHLARLDLRTLRVHRLSKGARP